MKLAVIFIGTGRYLDFLPTWYESCQEYLATNSQKTYFVFTDGELSEIPKDITFVKEEHLPWPYITLLRFKSILKIKEKLKDFDYVLFLDADMRVVDEVTEKELFTDKKYIGVHHPCHFLGMPPHNNPPGAFENNPHSRACIVKENDTSVYFQGCVWGGRVPYVIEMMEELADRTDDDLSRDVVAVWHDESQMNKFYSERREDVHVLGPEYAYPECFSSYCKFEPKMVHLDKENSKYHI